MTKKFGKWSKKKQISSKDLKKCLVEVVDGQFGVNLGGHVYKKRVARPGQGKSGRGAEGTGWNPTQYE